MSEKIKTPGSDAAFPHKTKIPLTETEIDNVITHSGLTKRELFAAMAMQGLVSSLTIGRDEHLHLMAQTAVEYADALISELAKDNKTNQPGEG